MQKMMLLMKKLITAREAKSLADHSDRCIEGEVDEGWILWRKKR